MMRAGAASDATSGISVAWSHPRTWQSHPLGAERHWVETEVAVTRDGLVIDQLSWSAPLSDTELAVHDQAILAKWRLLG
jgi:hypothetical protein